MSTTRTIIGAALLLAVITTPTIAGKILGTSRQTVYPQNFSTSLVSTVSVYGDWIETIGSATSTSPGVFVTIVDKFNGAQHTSQPFAGRGEVTLKITTNGATPGVKTIRLSGGIFGEASFTITVPESPTVTNVAVPAPADPFKEIIVTLTGTGLQNAIDPADGKIVKDNLVNCITVGGDVLVSSVRVLSSSEHTLQFKVFLSGFVQDVTVDLSFRTAGNVNVPLLNGLKQRIRMKSANVRNYVRSITFPNGSTFDKNSIATVRLNLLSRPHRTVLARSPSVDARSRPVYRSGIRTEKCISNLYRGTPLSQCRMGRRSMRTGSRQCLQIPGMTSSRSPSRWRIVWGVCPGP
ncbi:MAG: hypothetical protein IPI01_00215 [Ignavibacteriae bacterium]|nr:hypothetical protein [Ignavibacteriota bacterium]